MKVSDINKSKFFISEWIKWLGVLFLIIVFLVFYNLYCNNCNIILKIFFIVFMITSIIFVIFTTKLGKLMIVFTKESYIELKSVVWPSFQDGMYTTVVVVFVTVFMSLILWGLDTILVYMISFGLRL